MSIDDKWVIDAGAWEKLNKEIERGLVNKRRKEEQNRTTAQLCADAIWKKYMDAKHAADSERAEVAAKLAAKEELLLEMQAGCTHFWKEYHGFRHGFEYCIFCDAKRDLTGV